MQKFFDFFRDLFEAIFVPYVPPMPSVPSTDQSDAVTFLPWTFPSNCRHNVRVICDQKGLTVEEKNTLCATVGGESGWKPTAIGAPNSNGTRDWGICQINDALWIGPGKLFPSTGYVLQNPEACIRWMCDQWKVGHRTWWIAYKNGSYKHYL